MTKIADDSNQTPLMKQYWEMKAQAGDALLLFRMGDFYELFGDDAVEAARILEITLTSRDKNKPNPMPMAGVPHHSIAGYIQRLLKAGKKVALGDQLEDPAATKGIVKRGVTRIYTPGVQFDLEGYEANYLATLVAEKNGWSLACLDASTGEALISETLTDESAVTELGGLPVRHLIRVGGSLPAEIVSTLPTTVLVEDLPTNYLSSVQAQALLKSHYGLDQLGAFIPSDAAAHALGILVQYVLKTQYQEKLAHLQLPSPLRKPKTMVLGPRTAQHLDLLPGTDATPNLYQLINRTRSALGARALKRWLLAPLKSSPEIALRQEAVKEIANAGSSLQEKLGTELGEVYDLERICGRVNTRLANPRDTLQLGRSLCALSQIAGVIGRFQSATTRELSTSLSRLSDQLAPLGQEIVKNQKEDAPISAKDGGIFNTGANSELDHLIGLTENGQRWLVDLETREREATGIPSLKVRYNRVFGYYIEITSAHLKNVPSHYQRKQTMVGAERFFTEELKKFEDDILNASTKQKALELQLFEELLAKIQAQTPAIMQAARILGEVDALLALARLSDEPGWAFPVIDDSMDVEIRDGRHPLVDMASGGAFVPNDLLLSNQTRQTLMITGPNMGGKSTVMRQTALILILGQMGAPVPASSARWGVVSSLYTRIGAHDAIARGQSTFMVEMSELAHILHYADKRSFIVLDEIGRGTSTYDGMSVAWATLEWICNQIQARTLFATHYHELTRLTGTLPLLANAHMAVESERKGGARGSASLRFLYKLQEGPANESFGIHVAQIAGLPKKVTDRAWKVLDELENGSHASAQGGNPNQLSLFDVRRDEPEEEETPVEPQVVYEEHPVVAELGRINVNEMTPVQALNLVFKLQELSRAPETTAS